MPHPHPNPPLKEEGAVAGGFELRLHGILLTHYATTRVGLFAFFTAFSIAEYLFLNLEQLFAGSIENSLESMRH